MKQSLVIVTGITLLASPALGNPIATEVLRARAVAGPHVQLTYGVDTGHTSSGPTTPSQVTTYGSAQTPWSAPVQFRTNTGSGVVPVTAIQMCDCNVPNETTLRYEISVAISSNQTSTLVTTVSTPVRMDASPAPTDPDAGVMPWDIPDPTEVQGIDCVEACAAMQPGVDASVDAPTVLTQDAGLIINLDAALVFPYDARPVVVDGEVNPIDVPTIHGIDGATLVDGPIIAAPDAAVVRPDVTVADATAARDAEAAGVDGSGAPIHVADASVNTGADASTQTDEKSDDGCSCSIGKPGQRAGIGGLLLLGAVLALTRRRRA